MSAVGVTSTVHSSSAASVGEHVLAAGSVSSSSDWCTRTANLPHMNLDAAGLIDINRRTQMAVSYEPVGVAYSSQSSQRPLPALSLIKLYIGQYVLEYGAPGDAEQVGSMISRSDDDVAAGFYQRYPESVDTIASEYGLFNTSSGAKWGVSRTTAEDVVSFISQLRMRDPHSKVLEAMRHWSPVAADGYRQSFGLAGLPGAEGAKMGWSNGRSWHSSVVFGPGFVMAAITEGRKNDHTEDVAAGIASVEYEDLIKSGREKGVKAGGKATRDTSKARAADTGLREGKRRRGLAS